MSNIAARLYRALLAAGVPVVMVSIGDERDRRTWKVQPSSLQAAAQALINAFDPNDPQLLIDERGQRIAGLSREPDILATCALVVRSRNIAAWNALTTEQKIVAILDESDAWAQARDFVERTM